MQHKKSSLNKSSAADWQILAELELPVGVNAADAVKAWLPEILKPLKLHADFLSKILKSAQDSVKRALQVEAAIKFEHIHIIIFVQSEHTSKGRAWGFFRIEKVGASIENGNSSDHTIEFYLYLEG